jgi:uncharacterized protein YcfL
MQARSRVATSLDNSIALLELFAAGGYLSTMRAWLLLLLAPLLLVGCAPSAEQLADNRSVETSGVSPEVYDKFVHNQDLSLADIQSLARAGVSNHVISRYLNHHFTVYIVHDNDVKSLRAAGVSRRVICHLLTSGMDSPPDMRLNFPGPIGPYTRGPFERSCVARDTPFLR